MNDEHASGLAEATKLTRAGRLAEATALIQRLLRGGAASTAEPETPHGPGRFQRSTLRSNIDPARAEEFGRYVDRAGTGMLTAADDELARHEDADAAQPETFGIGVFMFRDDPAPDDDGSKS